MLTALFKRRWIRWPAWLVLGFALFGVVPRYGPLRNLLAAPLIVHDAGASGEAAYIMGGDHAYEERLMAASDLIHEGRAQVLYLLKDGTRARHHYASGQDRVASDWHLDYLRWLGVSEDRVRFIETSGGALDSLAEARTMATELADHPEIKRLVIVTSATHTRRSLMAFKAALPPEITPVPYAANLYLASAEVHRPLWIEYVKLVVYALRLVAS